MISYDCKKLIFKIIKNIPKTVLNILCMPFFLVFMVIDNIKYRILYHSSEESKQSFLKFLASHGGNTEYEIKCPKCGYNTKQMIGGSHTSDLKGYFSTELVYCPSCREPLEGGFVHYRKKSDGENKTYNKRCPNCLRKTKKYDIHQSDIKLKCPKCGSDNLEITDLQTYWMT